MTYLAIGGGPEGRFVLELGLQLEVVVDLAIHSARTQLVVREQGLVAWVPVRVLVWGCARVCVCVCVCSPHTHAHTRTHAHTHTQIYVVHVT